MLVMFNAGIIGNFGTQYLLAQTLSMHANYYRKEGTPAFEIKDFVPDLWKFIEPPKTIEEQKMDVQQKLSMIGGVTPQMMMDILRKNEEKIVGN